MKIHVTTVKIKMGCVLYCMLVVSCTKLLNWTYVTDNCLAIYRMEGARYLGFINLLSQPCGLGLKFKCSRRLVLYMIMLVIMDYVSGRHTSKVILYALQHKVCSQQSRPIPDPRPDHETDYTKSETVYIQLHTKLDKRTCH